MSADQQLEEISIAVRRATAADLPDVVAVHLDAFDGYMNTRLGASYLTPFYRWFILAPTGIAFVALDRQSVVGYAVGAPAGYSSAVTRSTWFGAALGLARRPGLLLDPRIRGVLGARAKALVAAPPVLPLTPRLAEPVYSLVGIGVAPSARGRSVGRMLIRQFERDAAGRGAATLRLSVYSTNAAACRLYESAGWRRQEDRQTSVVEYAKPASDTPPGPAGPDTKVI